MAILRGSADTIEVFATAEVSGDLGKVQKVKFKAKFKRLTKAEMEAKSKAVASGELPIEDIIRDDLLGWRDMEGDGGEVPFDEDTLAQALEIPAYVKALADAWADAQFGRLLANAKN